MLFTSLVRANGIRRRAGLSPEVLLIGGFAALIGVGTVLLWLPFSHHGGVGLSEALFTATSAVCVTGLVVVDTGRELTLFGQLVVLGLIQAGGLGVMTFAAVAFRLVGRRLSLKAQSALSQSLIQRDVLGETRQLFWRLLRVVLVIEGVGVAVLFVGFLKVYDPAHAFYTAVFHAVSAFCNAGFSLYGDSLTALRGNVLVVSGVLGLILLGGIGHPVLVDVWQRIRRPRGNGGPQRLTLHSRVTLAASAGLVFGGAALLLITGLTYDETNWWSRTAGALFQSISSRTAGFNSIDISALPAASLFVLVVLMFIGGSPGSCAGGVKTTTITLWAAQLWGRLRGDKWPRLFGRHIPGELGRRAGMVLGLSVLWNVIGLLVLLVTDGGPGGAGMEQLLFEQISAFGTVGLSTGITPHVSTVGRLWLVATMFVGRVGPLTVVMWLVERKRSEVRYPEGRLMIG